MAVFNVIVNNADRKGAHIVPMHVGHRHGVDHGLTVLLEGKLRMVLWGWLCEALIAEERDDVGPVVAGLDGELGPHLTDLLCGDKVDAFTERCAPLLDDGRFPTPSGWTPTVPWPLF